MYRGSSEIKQSLPSTQTWLKNFNFLEKVKKFKINYILLKISESLKKVFLSDVVF